MFAQRSAAAYATVGVETGVTTADPHKLVLMLFDGALLCVGSAKQHMVSNEIAAKGENVSKAINIIANGLKASLDMGVGGELAERLAALYDYMCERLLFANMKNNPTVLEEVHRLLSELKEAWEQIGTTNAERESIGALA
ncbi:MAG: flagellar export chaperone FliS [Rhodocyclaceae bacterium]